MLALEESCSWSHSLGIMNIYAVNPSDTIIIKKKKKTYCLMINLKNLRSGSFTHQKYSHSQRSTLHVPQPVKYGTVW